jgi:hypothetical protein
MEDIKYKPIGKEDEKLEFLKTQCKKAVEMLLEAMKKMDYGMRFKAFEFTNIKDNEIGPLSDLISTAIAIEINSQAKETLNTHTYECKIEKADDKHYFWIMVKKEKPDWESVPKVEELPIEDVVLPEKQESEESESDISEESIPKKVEVEFETLSTHYTNALNYIV